jgi:hypothetical protein
MAAIIGCVGFKESFCLNILPCRVALQGQFAKGNASGNGRTVFSDGYACATLPGVRMAVAEGEAGLRGASDWGKGWRVAPLSAVDVWGVARDASRISQISAKSEKYIRDIQIYISELSQISQGRSFPIFIGLI